MREAGCRIHHTFNIIFATIYESMIISEYKVTNRKIIHSQEEA